MPRPPSRDDKLYLGCDPGKTGGLVRLAPNGEVLSAVKMPATERDVWDWFNFGTNWTRVCLIEAINPGFKGTGKSSMAKLYGNYCMLRAFAVASGCRLEHITTLKWARGLGIPKKSPAESKTDWKNRLKAKAQLLFPQERVTLAIADALLIAEYARRSLK